MPPGTTTHTPCWQETVALRMIERLDLVNILPRWALDASAGGPGLRRARYAGSRIVVLDLARVATSSN
ncbi:MAG: hypothetical protein ACREXK_05825 [Gammaproteobacteria bacterium]